MKSGHDDDAMDACAICAGDGIEGREVDQTPASRKKRLSSYPSHTGREAHAICRVVFLASVILACSMSVPCRVARVRVVFLTTLINGIDATTVDPPSTNGERAVVQSCNKE